MFMAQNNQFDKGQRLGSDWPKTPLVGVTRKVHDRIRSMILRRDVDPGARIAIDQVARALGVSQTPVREALSRLEAEGLVTRIPNSGYFAAEGLTRDQVAQLFEIRLLVEPHATRKAALNITDADLADLKALQEASRELAASDGLLSYSKFAEIDFAIHQIISASTANFMLSDLVERIETHFHLFRRGYDAHMAPEAVDEHARIIDALVARDADAAEAAMREHIVISGERMRLFFERLAPKS